MSDPDYLETQQTLAALVPIVAELDLTAFLQRIETADAVAPITDPTLYVHGSRRMHEIRALAEGAREFQQATRKIGAGEESRHAPR